MSPLFAKLNWKGHSPIWVLDAPASFASELAAMTDVPMVDTAPSNGDTRSIAFLLAFVTTHNGVADIAALVARHTTGDSMVWLAYPKLTSKRYTCELNRDQGWDPMRAIGFETVRQVAIDEDWSALRFRRAEYIGTKSR